MTSMHAPTSLDALVALVREARDASRPLQWRGAGTWLSGGGAVDPAAESVSLRGFGGIIEYEPGDLTITVGAATTIAELDAVTAAHKQWCPLAPWGGDAGTVGATIATATAGPYRAALGAPRDLVLGLECVDGTGQVLRPGGKVVKNVAGFDLTRLMTGAWGTLGAITRVSLRLRARPMADETWALAVPSMDIVERLRRGPTPPLAVEPLDAAMRRAARLPDTPHLLVRLGGNAAFVAAARREAAAIGALTPADPALWLALREQQVTAARREPSPGERMLGARVRDAFDPARILNRGLME